MPAVDPAGRSVQHHGPQLGGADGSTAGAGNGRAEGAGAGEPAGHQHQQHGQWPGRSQAALCRISVVSTSLVRCNFYLLQSQRPPINPRLTSDPCSTALLRLSSAYREMTATAASLHQHTHTDCKDQPADEGVLTNCDRAGQVSVVILPPVRPDAKRTVTIPPVARRSDVGLLPPIVLR